MCSYIVHPGAGGRLPGLLHEEGKRGLFIRWFLAHARTHANHELRFFFEDNSLNRQGEKERMK